WNIASLAAGASTVVQFSGVIDNAIDTPPPPNGSILLADVTATAFGGVQTNHAVTILTSAPLDLAVSGTPQRAAPGASVTYTASFGNGSAGAIGATLRVPLPPGTSFVSASGGGALNGGVVEWNLGVLPAGFFDRRKFVVQVSSAAFAG